MEIKSKKFLADKHILLGVTGGIAAYKSTEIIRQLVTLGAQVRVVLTEGGSQFITAETLRALSSHPVYQCLFGENEANISHIELARWADAILIAPATAHYIAKLAHGFADDLLSTLCLARNSSMLVVPSMNQYMWENEATRKNVQLLQNNGVYFCGPDDGVQACGEVGLGRMIEPQAIIEELNALFALKCLSKYLLDKKVLITAGPTKEAIDPVRYLTNHSSGKMGYAIAEAVSYAGAQVTLISGPTYLNSPSLVSRINVTTALEMRDTVMDKVSDCDLFISVAAVSDYRVKNVSPKKIKKNEEEYGIELVKNPDIIAEVAKLPKKPITVGFAAETEMPIENALKKLKAKNLDMIICNLVGGGKGFESDFNELYVITKKYQKELGFMHKQELARKLVEIIKDTFFN